MADLLKLPFSVLCLFGAIMVYALFGSPTPDDPAIAELVIGVLLVLAAGVGTIRRLRLLESPENIFLRSLHLFFLVGLIVPSVTGIWHGNDSYLIVRDVLAFLFLCLPLFLATTIEETKTARILLPLLMLFCGIVFAIRTLIPAFNIWVPEGELLYLSNSPLVLFAAIFFTCVIWQALGSPTLRFVLLAEASMAGLALITAAMLLDVQRATVGAIVLTLVVLFVTTLIKSPKKVIMPLIVTMVASVVFFPVLLDAFQAVARKTADVGFNMRFQEIEAVLGTLTSDPFGLFVGSGWGGTFASPAVGLLDVNYTHSLLSTMLLKGGLVLLAPALFVCGTAFHQIFIIFQQDRAKGLMLLWPFAIPVFLYASHKSLDFGLLLLLIGVWSIQAGRLQPAGGSCMEKEQSFQDK